MHFTRNISVMLLILTAVVTFAGQPKSDFSLFWENFRQAVLQNKIDQVASMTRFPLEVRGVDDSDPVRHYGIKQFKTLWKKFLSQSEILPSGESISTVELILEKNEISKDDVLTPDLVRVYDMEFEYVNGRWLLTRCYLAE